MLHDLFFKSLGKHFDLRVFSTYFNAQCLTLESYEREGGGVLLSREAKYILFCLSSLPLKHTFLTKQFYVRYFF